MRTSSLMSSSRLAAALVLLLSALLPLHALPASGTELVPVRALDLARDDAVSAAWLALAYLWPALLALALLPFGGRARRLGWLVASPPLALLSGAMLWAIGSFSLGVVEVLPLLLVPASGSAASGTYVAVAADAAFVAVWLVDAAAALFASSRPRHAAAS